MPDHSPEPARLPNGQGSFDSVDESAGRGAPGPAGQADRVCDHGSANISAPPQGCGDGEDSRGSPGLSWCWELDYEQLLAALDGRSGSRSVADAESTEETESGSAKKGSARKGSARKRSARDAAAENGAAQNGAAQNGAAQDGRQEPDEDQDAVLDEILASEGRVLSAAEVTGRVAEFLPPGPGLAGWLATTPAAELDDTVLAGVAASWRRLAAWAQAGELATVAQIAARAAVRDKDIGVAADGRPARICADATGEVSLALVMSQCGASWWTDLAVTLSWRLARTGAALRDGAIDLSRARLIAEATSMLSEDAARAVEEKVLSRAGGQTLGQLRAALRRAVIIADPDGAERRREEAERRAKVCLYPDEEGTATLAGQSLPGIRAAAAMARITAMARAMKASGAGGGIDLLRAQVFIGLLLGTLPYIPPAPGGPVDEPPDDDFGDAPAYPDHDESPGPARGRSYPDSAAPGRGRPAGGRDGSASSSGRDADGRPKPRTDSAPDSGPPDPPPSADPDSKRPAGPDPPGPEPPGTCSDSGPPAGPDPPGPEPPGARSDSGPPDPELPAGPDPPGLATGAGPDPPGPDPLRLPNDDPWADLPGPDDWCAPTDGASADDDETGLEEAGLAETAASGWGFGRDIDDDTDGPGPPGWPTSPWPALPTSLPLGRSAAPVGGTLDLTVPLATLAGLTSEPGSLSRLGPVTGPEGRKLAILAAVDPAVRWRIILTNASGQALAVTHVPRARFSQRAGAGHSVKGLAAGRGHAGLVGRVTIIIPEYFLNPAASDQLNELGPSARPAGNLAALLGVALHAAALAAAQVKHSQAADACSGGCAHHRAAAGYRPPPNLREYITARDLTCRFITCRQPAWRADLDHTIPWDQGGRTCSCNLGGLCRFHHRLKQRLGWSLAQSAPGIFTWTTPTGRAYTIAPDRHL